MSKDCKLANGCNWCLEIPLPLLLFKSPRYTSPFKILKQVTYKLDLPDPGEKPPDFMCPFSSPLSTDQSVMTPPLPLEIEGQPAYIREKYPELTLSTRSAAVPHWVGRHVPEEQCWIPAHNILDPNLYRDFHANHPECIHSGLQTWVPWTPLPKTHKRTYCSHSHTNHCALYKPLFDTALLRSNCSVSLVSCHCHCHYLVLIFAHVIDYCFASLFADCLTLDCYSRWVCFKFWIVCLLINCHLACTCTRLRVCTIKAPHKNNNYKKTPQKNLEPCGHKSDICDCAIKLDYAHKQALTQSLV